MTTSTPPLPLPPLPASAALFLDFDGTLVAIAERPQDVRVPGWLVPTLHRLEQRQGGALALVSGRPISQLDAFLNPLRLMAAGAHGAERRGVSGQIERRLADPPAGVAALALALAADHAGLLFESKPSGFSLHYRARPDLESMCRDALLAAVAAEPGADAEWGFLHGHCVFELKQRSVSKGTALRAFLAEPVFAGRLPIFVGDDVTDEDGIAAAQAAGGFGVRIGSGPSQAAYRLADTDAVAAWLMAATPDTPIPKQNPTE